jgi:hypothetical protein
MEEDVMQVSSNGKVYRTKDEWRKVFAQFAKSGLSRQEFCTEEKITKSSFDRWHKRLAEQEPQGGFVEVVPAVKSTSWAVEVELGGGTVVRVGRS